MRFMRLCLMLILAGLAVRAAAADEVLCVLKQFSGKVRVETDGASANAARGALYAGQLLVLDKGADVTLVVGKELVDLSGPLELPITSAVLEVVEDSGGKGLLARLAELLPGLSDGGAYTSGAVRGEGEEGTPFQLLGPRGTLLSNDLLFQPLGDPARCTLRLIEQGQRLLELRLATESVFRLSGLAPGDYEYEYATDDPATQGGWPPVRFTIADSASAAPVLAQLPQDSALAQALYLAGAGYPYEAWRCCLDALEREPAAAEAPLLLSLRDRLGGTLLEQ
jgi:hypothetical protein